MKLLDTSVLIDLDRGGPGTPNKAAALDRTGPHAIASVTVFEYMLGLYLKHSGSALEAALEKANEFLSAFLVLPLDAGSSRRAAEIASDLRKSGVETGIQDVYLAAIAFENGLRLVTANPRHFERIRGLGLRNGR